MEKGAGKERQELFERCALCKKITSIRKDTPIQQRKTYLRGAGQLCESCCLKLYGTNDLTQI